MRIVKYCSEKYNINSAPNIQLGTLEYYQTHENLLIKDSSEGFYSDQIEHKETTDYSMSELNELYSGVRFQGSGKIKMMNGSKLVIKDKTYPNVYIFCATKIDDTEKINPEMGKQFNESYNSFYEIKNPQKFADKIKKLLIQKLLDLYPGGKQLVIDCFYREITYVNEKISIFNSRSEAVLARNNRQTIEKIFIKTKESLDHPGCNFEKNREYRFAWLVFNKQGSPFLTKDNTILINTKPLREFAE
ncbi:MAG: hypothetical protein PHR00_02635 [Patescibacteria group bacterium]|nr:hypothetical protein [Patescibacteria group bacterium]